MDKALFLDMDGVANGDKDFIPKGFSSQVSIHPIGIEKIHLIRKILEKTGAKIVLSSTWRHGWSIEQFEAVFSVFSFGFDGKFIGKTPSIRDATRGQEIDKWLKDNNFHGNFVILDDDSDMEPHMDHLVQTDGTVGLTPQDMRKAIEILNRESNT